MQGPDVPNTGNLGLVRMTQIGPTIASWFEVSLSPKADSPIAQLVKAAAPREAVVRSVDVVRQGGHPSADLRRRTSRAEAAARSSVNC